MFWPNRCLLHWSGGLLAFQLLFLGWVTVGREEEGLVSSNILNFVENPVFVPQPSLEG